MTRVLSLVSVLAGAGRAEGDVGLTASAQNDGIHVHIELGGGSVVKWSALDQTGNAFGGLVLLRLADLEFGLGAAVVLPDSRTQADFAMLWAEGRYHFLGYPTAGALAISPYASLALGVSFEDGSAPLPSGFIPARWSREANVAIHYGIGARWGGASGMYLAAEARGINHTHLGLQLLVGYAFP